MNRRRGGGRVSMMQVAFASREGPEPPDVHVERLRFWWEPPQRLREEVSSETPAQTRTTVLDGELWWTYSPDWGAVSNVDLDEKERAEHGVGGGDRFRPLLDPSGLSAVLDFDQVVVAGDRLRVRARPRDDLEGPPIHFHLRVVAGADAFELEVDRTLGFVRRMAALLDGEELSVTELSEIAFDEAFPPETFVFEPPPGVEVLPPETGRHKRYTLDEAAEAAPFPVFFKLHRGAPPAPGSRQRLADLPPRRRPRRPLARAAAGGRGRLRLARLRPARARADRPRRRPLLPLPRRPGTGEPERSCLRARRNRDPAAVARTRTRDAARTRRLAAASQRHRLIAPDGDGTTRHRADAGLVKGGQCGAEARDAHARPEVDEQRRAAVRRAEAASALGGSDSPCVRRGR